MSCAGTICIELLLLQENILHINIKTKRKKFFFFLFFNDALQCGRSTGKAIIEISEWHDL